MNLFGSGNMTLVMNRQLADQLENAEIEALSSRLTEIQKIEGKMMHVLAFVHHSFDRAVR